MNLKKFKKSLVSIVLGSSLFLGNGGVICHQLKAWFSEDSFTTVRETYKDNPNMTLIIDFVKSFSDKNSDSNYKDEISLLYIVFKTCTVDHLSEADKLDERLDNIDELHSFYYLILQANLFCLLEFSCCEMELSFEQCPHCFHRLNEGLQIMYENRLVDNGKIIESVLIPALDLAKKKLDEFVTTQNDALPPKIIENCNGLLTDTIRQYAAKLFIAETLRNIDVD